MRDWIGARTTLLARYISYSNFHLGLDLSQAALCSIRFQVRALTQFEFSLKPLPVICIILPRAIVSTLGKTRDE